MGEISGLLERSREKRMMVPILVSRTGAVGWTKRRIKAPKPELRLLKTAGRWPWKSESAKECVTNHLPKQLALKMDGAIAPCL